MQVTLGPFHPDLEDSLVREIQTIKGDDPLAPLLVLVPSIPIRSRVKVLLAEESGLVLINLHLLTFHQLSHRLRGESWGEDDGGPMEELFFEELLREILREFPAGESPFPGLEETPGGCAALWQTLRDLKDGMVDPETVLEGFREGVLSGEGSRKGIEVLNLYREVRERADRLGIRDYTDLDIRAAESVPVSPFLKGFRTIFYYGVYDLTQVQLDLFQSIARSYPVTLFFPLMEKDPAWEFAERFYRRYLRGMVVDPKSIRSLRSLRGSEGDEAIHGLVESVNGGIPSSLKVSILSCSGTRDEVLTAAKEMVRLHEEEGIPFHRIGLTAREIGRYGNWVREIFPKHGIPLTGEGGESLVRFPLTQAVFLLLELPGDDYLRSRVIDLLASPHFNAAGMIPEGVRPRPDLWDSLSRKFGITRGIDEWKRLRFVGLENAPPFDPLEDREVRLPIPVSEGEILHGIVSRLHEELEGIPEEGAWSDYAGRWKVLLDRFLKVGTEGSDPDPVAEAIFRTLERMAELDRIVTPIPRDRFVRTFRSWLERGSIRLREEEIAGVTVGDAMAVRGLSFQALLILGLNEGIFPRVIREDPFLKDDLRRSIDTVLGSKVPEKLAGYDEERLLFTLLTGAARHRLYLFYQRSDDAGRAAAASGYLLEFRRNLNAQAEACGYPDSTEEREIPRGILDKETVPPFDRLSLLTPHEAAIRSILRNRDPVPLLESFSLHPELYRRGVQTLQSLGTFRNELTGYDGVTGPLPEVWQTILRRGISPTALQDYARCPFFFFIRRLLGVNPLESPEEVLEVDRSTLGEIGHEILRNFHQTLIDRNGYRSGEPSADLLHRIVQRTFSDHEIEHPVGYPVLWEVLKEEMEEALSRMTDRDLSDLIQSGYRPAGVEVSCHGRFPDDWPEPLGGLPLSGRLDRIDRDDTGKTRVIDYKFSWAKHSPPEDRNLLKRGIRGERLQPPFYLRLGGGAGTGSANEAAFYYLLPRGTEGPFEEVSLSEEAWEGENGDLLRETLVLLLCGIRDGIYFIYPGSHCGKCEFATLCRKDHRPTRWRTVRDPRIESLRRLKTR